MIDTNISFLINESISYDPIKKNVITTDVLRELCGVMDSQAYHAAVVGFVLSMVSIVYFGRLRNWLMNNKRLPGWIVPFTDKLLLTSVALCFAIIIVRLLRAS